jgi:2-methylcitrate dehydratase PrpD
MKFSLCVGGTVAQSVAIDPMTVQKNPSALLAGFCARIRYEDLPAAVVSRTEEAFVDWFGCALAGRGSRPINILETFASTMGPADGPSEILVSRKRTSPFFASLVNGAASHIVEMDDVHNGGMFHPATVVFPAVFAAAQHVGASGKEFITASVAGYEAAVRTAEFLGPDHYKIFHKTGTAGTLGAAAAVARVLGLNGKQTLDALGTAGTQAAGLWEFLRDAADSKPLHSGKAASNGLLAAYLAQDGFTGASRILEGEQGLAAALSRGGSTDPARLTEGLGERWVVLECTYKPYSCCRHTHPSADALTKVMRENNLQAGEIAHVTAHVHQGAVEVLGKVIVPETIYQAKFCLGFVLALIANRGRAGVSDFTEDALKDPKLRAFRERVEMVLDPSIPRDIRVRPGRVEVETTDGRRFEARVAATKGDPGNSLTREEIREKTQQLAASSGAATPGELDLLISRAWEIHDASNLEGLYLKSL